MITNIGAFASRVYGEVTLSRTKAVIFGVAAFGLMICEMVFGHLAAHMLATGTVATWLAVGAVFACIIKAGWLTTASVYWQERAIGSLIAVVAFGLIAHLYSFQAILGLAATGREMIIGERGGDIGKVDRAKERYEAARKERDALAGQRPVEKVAADIDRVRAEIVAAESREAEAKAKEAEERKTYCGSRCNAYVTAGQAAAATQAKLRPLIKELEAELVTARKADDARAEYAKALEAVNATPAVTQHADPQASVFVNYAALVGVITSSGTVGLLLLLPVAFLIEFGAPLGFKIAAAEWSRGQVQRTAEAPSLPSGGVSLATRAPDGPIPQLPAKPPSQEEQAFIALRRMIAHQPEGKVPATLRPLGAALGEAIGLEKALAPETMNTYLKRWHEAGRIVRSVEGTKVFVTLAPTQRALVRAEARMVAA